jgi:hypothetical protein
VKRRIYIEPECGHLTDCSARPHSWDSSGCVVLRDDTLWQRYLDAERACEEARQAVLAVATEEPMTPEEQALHEREDELHMMLGLDSGEWMRRHDEIEAEARRLAESDIDVSVPVDDEGVSP